MKPVFTFFLVLLSLQFAAAQDVEVIKYPQLLEMIENDEPADIVIYNFWATWCAPCIKEMPYFEKVNQEEHVVVRFISLDDVEKIENRVKPFIEKKEILSHVYLLDETDYNSFIDKISPDWSGAIPATLIINNKTRSKEFYEKEFHEGELEKLVHN